MSVINSLIEWYKLNCNGDWEHSYGVKIDTLDNPGWRISIDLKETNLENFLFEEVEIQRDDDDWVFCKVEDDIFYGACGVNNLLEVIDIFIQWSKNPKGDCK